MKTPTPRTDAAERKAHGIPDGFELLPNLYVSGDFARQLENELATITTLADRLAKQLQAWVEASGNMFFQEDVEALTTYENHKKGNTP